MKNKLLVIILLTTTLISFASCASSRGGRKGYGCPSTVKSQPVMEQNKV